MNNDLLIGKLSSHLNKNFGLYKDVVAPYRYLESLAQKEGFEISIASGFRSFDRQMLIWTEKMNGTRPLLSLKERPLNPKDFAPDELLDKMLIWSAIPGTSRHHWGTDFDIIETSNLAPNYQIQLRAEECQPGGVFYSFHQWLTEVLKDKDIGFRRPFDGKKGHVAQEKWHLSHTTSAALFEREYTIDFFENMLKQNALPLYQEILERKEEIYENYIACYFKERL